MTEELLVSKQEKKPAIGFVGKPLRKLEDLQIIRGKAGYTDDFEFADQYYAAILTSPYAHAKIKRIDASKARSLPGVIYVLTGDEVASRTKPMVARAAERSPMSHYILAVNKVRYMGEPVAVAVAKDKYTAHDATELIEVEYEPLPPVVTIESALKPDAPLIYEELDSNEIVSDKFSFGNVADAFKSAKTTVKERFLIHRYSSTPLETFVVNSFYDNTRDELTSYASDQQPGRTVQALERTLGLSVGKIHLYVPPVGGGFGQKLAMWQYVALISLASIITGKAVKWVQTRMENLSAFHRPESYMDAEFALSSDGKILGMRLVEFLADGNWPYVAGLYSLIKFANMSGLYEIRNHSYEYHCIATNQPPVVQDRGVGKPFMSFVLERLADLSAKKLGMDPFEFRLKNVVSPDKMPYTCASGEVYESGNYPAALRKARELSGYAELKSRKKEEKEQRSKGRHPGKAIGVGISCGIEPGTSNLGYYYLSKPGLADYNGAGQMATVEMVPGGVIKVNMNSPEIGTGHVTTIAQVIADQFGLEPEQVVVDPRYNSDLGHLGYAGTFSNAFNDVYIGAIMRAANALKSKVLKIAAAELGADTSELELRNGFVQLKSDPNKRISFREIGVVSYNRLLSLPEDVEPGLRSVAGYANRTAKPFRRQDFNVQLTHSYSCHVAVVEVDLSTGMVKFLGYYVVHDAGNVINPGIVEGLAVGSTASGIGAALYEQFVFDDTGSNLSVTFGEYLKPTAMEVPEMTIEMMETPAPNTPLGTKAVGEGGAITSLAAVANAVEDALSEYNVKITELPLTPERILSSIKKKQ